MTTTTTTTTSTTSTNYWTKTAEFVAIFGDELYACEEVRALTTNWNQHRFGVCCECDIGLDDEADFIITGNANEDDTAFMCYGCFATTTSGPTYGH